MLAIANWPWLILDAKYRIEPCNSPGFTGWTPKDKEALPIFDCVKPVRDSVLISKVAKLNIINNIDTENKNMEGEPTNGFVKIRLNIEIKVL